MFIQQLNFTTCLRQKLFQKLTLNLYPQKVYRNAWHFRNFDRNFEAPILDVVERAKLINFGIETHNESLVIVVKVKPDKVNEENMHVYLELHPSKAQEYLPPSLHVMILDEEGTSVLEAKAKNDNRKIELELSGAVGDNFCVKIALDNFSVTENFVI